MALLKLEDIRKTYNTGENAVEVLKGINLEIQEEEYLALMGPSGSGKSTLMNIIGCLDVSTGGKYYLDGHNVETYNDDKLAEIRNHKIGFVFQQFNLMPKMSAQENVAVPLIYSGVPEKERMDRAAKMLTNVGLGERIDHKPNELSGGQSQRVAIARALINNPSLILADEPTGNLDSKTSLEIMEIFDRLNREGNTIMLVTHEEDIAEHSKRIVRLRDGVIESDKRIK